MPLSLVHDGKVLDFHFKKTHEAFITNFYCGDIFMGQIFKIGKSWTAVPKERSDYAPYHGFRTRYDAAVMILKVNGYYKS
jgi:hypothetical protein